jgi:hypothetical protein
MIHCHCVAADIRQLHGNESVRSKKFFSIYETRRLIAVFTST